MSRLKLCSLLLVLGATLVGPRAFSISRVGNAFIGDQAQGFTAAIPQSFVEVSLLTESGLRLKSPGVDRIKMGFPNPILSRPTIDIYQLQSEYRDLPKASRSESQRYFVERGALWVELKTSHPCVLALSSRSGDVVTTVLNWGAGKGIVLVGSDSDSVPPAIDQIVSTLKLDAGVCEWK